MTLFFRGNGALADERFFEGQAAGGPLGPFFTGRTLTAQQVAELYDLGRGALGI